MKRYITLLLTAALLMGMTACGKTGTPSELGSAPAAQQSDDPSAQPDAASQDDGSAAPAADAGNAPEVHIRLAEWENIEWETFNGVYVTMKVPKGWEVKETGSPPYNFYSVRRPAKEGEISNTGWTTADSYTFYHTQEYADKLNEQGGMHYATMKEPTTKAFYEAFWAIPEMEVTRFEVVAETNNGDNAVVNDFNPTDTMGITEKDNSSILAHWTQRGVEGTGLYSATITDHTLVQKVQDLSVYEQTSNIDDLFNAPWVEQDWGCYQGLGLKWFCAPTDEFDNWLPILKESYDSQVPTQAYWDAINEYNRQLFGSSWTNVGADSYEKDSITDTWWDMYQSREKSEDIMQEKRSDAILGYERVYDSDTGNVYRAYNGFMDDYTKSGVYTDGDNGTRYSYATDDQYTQGYSGWIDGYGDYLADSQK